MGRGLIEDIILKIYTNGLNIQTSKMRRKDKREIRRIITGIIPFISIMVMVCLFVGYMIKGDELKQNAVLTTGTVLKFHRDYRSNGGSIRYVFDSGGKQYENTGGYPRLYSDDGYNFEGKVFPVVYDHGDPGNSRMLITPGDFKTYNIPFPDTLNWVKKYVDED